MKTLNPDHPVIRLCTAGSQAELKQRPAEAAELYRQAWEASRTPLDACIAAHYCARLQPDPETELKWNQIALEKAQATSDERIQAFYPSLYLNLGQSYEKLSNQPLADECFAKALKAADHLDLATAETIRKAILAGHPQLQP